MTKQSTLCFIKKGSQVLLGMKKRGFGVGRWNGYGGKLVPGEDIEESLRRELMEEAQITLGKLEKRAIIVFVGQGLFDPNNGIKNEVHVFYTEEYHGMPAETEEMCPQWFELDALPFDTMWSDDLFWLPRVLAGEKIKARFEFGPEDKILSYEINQVQEL